MKIGYKSEFITSVLNCGFINYLDFHRSTFYISRTQKTRLHNIKLCSLNIGMTWHDNSQCSLYYNISQYLQFHFIMR